MNGMHTWKWCNFEAIASDSECKAMNSTAICEAMISLYDYRKAEIPYHHYQGTI